jgi:phosphosulfolactate synthase
MDIRREINNDDILWEAPLKSQQVWFIKLLGSNVNLGNICTTEVISLETLRLGLRGDTLLSFLP